MTTVGPPASREVAIVGLASRLPGAPDHHALWDLLSREEHAIGPVPAERWDASARLDPERRVQAVGGFLDRVADFDPTFFGISPREAADIDPQQRLMLEAVWSALEEGGHTAGALRGTRCGVYVGASWHDYEILRKDRGVRATQHSATGNALDVIAARVSYFLGLTGPSLTVETGCSSALVALHLAAQAIRHGEIDTALVGGVNLILAPDVSIGLTHFGGLSDRGLCQAFSAGADGFVRGEGVVALHLKPLEKALADGDRIHAVLAATAVNNDGGGDSLASPNPEGQEDLLRSVYGGAGLDPDRLAYVEAHGTGTPKGDPIEAGALGRVLGTARSAEAGPLRIGSVKTNIGHLEAAAGLAGLVKVILALRHRRLPASLHAEETNPAIDFDGLGLSLVREPVDLPGEDPLCMAVNSFGWGGTNAHAVLESPPEAAPADEPNAGEEPVPALFVPLSAHSQESLQRRASDLADALASGDLELNALAGTLGHRRDHLALRAAFTADTTEGVVEDLRALAAGADDLEESGRAVTGRPATPGRVAFVFPGQGHQWAGMGRDLYARLPVFRATVDRCARALEPYVDWDLAEIVTGGAGDGWMDRVDMVQPVLWAVSVGLAEAWRAAGVEPDVVVGHSQGEVSAATVSGALSYEDAARVVALRSRAVRALAGRGLMMAVELDRDAAQNALQGFEEFVSVAVNNGPTSCVLSGESESVLMLKELLEADGVDCRLVKVDYASHSPQVDEVAGPLSEDLAPVAPREGSLPLMSTVEVREMSGRELDAGYWVANLRRPVRFAETVSVLLEEGVTHVVEISAHPILTLALEGLVSEHDAEVLSTLRRDQGTTGDLARAFARAYAAGLTPVAHLPARNADLPPYPWNRTSFWAPEARRHRGGGEELTLTPLTVEQDAWQGELALDVDSHPWMDDHRVHDAVVFPGAGMLALALTTGRARGGALPRALSDVRFVGDLTLVDGAAHVACLWRDDTEGGGFTLLSLPEGGTEWTTHATARVHHATPAGDPPVFPASLTGAEAMDVDAFYARCDARGLRYGPAFRTVTELHRDTEAALGRIVLDERGRAQARPDAPHPALWDGALQVALALCGDDTTVVPTGVDRVALHEEPAESVVSGWSHVVRRDTHLFDVVLYDDEHRPLLAMEGLRLSPLEDGVENDADSGRLHHMTFVERPASEPDPALTAWAVIGAPEDGADLLADALAGTGATVHRGDTARILGEHPVDAVVHLAPAAARGLDAQRAGLAALTETVRACAGQGVPPRLTVLTRAAQAADPTEIPDPGGALYWGFSRVLGREHGELTPRVVDVGALDEVADAVPELLAADREDQVLVRSDRRMVGRLVAGAGDGGPVPVPWSGPYRPHRLASERPGLWETLVHRASTPAPPGPGQVQIRVGAAALNFIDVMKAMGTYPDPSGGDLFGGECAGRVTAVGEGVTGLEPGTAVVACVFGAAASHVTVSADHVRPIPDHLDEAEAVTLPLVAMTAWYGLHDLARLEEGETVLIHSAAGGLGQAAVQVARMLGARIIATAGTEDKRRMLRESGIEHVFDSRDLSWAEGVRRATGGRGVDVVLNSLSGPAIGLGLEVLAEDGRFVEVGKKDIYQGRPLKLTEFRKGVSFAAVDLAGLMSRRPERFARLFTTVWDLVCSGGLTPLPCTARPFAEAAEALRDMARGVHVGKIVLTDPATVTSITPEAMPDGRLRADGRYLITGGLGALGLSLAEHLAGRGAGHLALIGRSEPGERARERIGALRGRGVDVVTASADVADADQVGKLLADLREDGVPLCGVVHAAGVLDDATIGTLTQESMERVIRPKVDGARHLDAGTADDPLDFFVLFSSAAALVGNVGQAAYAAANAYLDALAAARRHRGLPALSVQWGPFTDVGLAAADANRGDRLADRGMGGFRTDEAWPALEALLAEDTPVMGYVPLNLRRWFDAYPETAAQPSWELLKEGTTAGAAEGDEFRSRLAAAPPEERSALVETKVRELAGRVLRMEPDAIGRRVPFKEFGLDSLMSLELRNRLEVAFGLKLSPTLLWTYGSADALAAALGERLTTSA